MFWVFVLAGCATPCEKVTDYLVEACGIVTAADDTVEECKRGSVATCEAECALAADCSIFTPPTEMTGDTFSAYLAAQAAHQSCLDACQPDPTGDTGPSPM